MQCGAGLRPSSHGMPSDCPFYVCHDNASAFLLKFTSAIGQGLMEEWNFNQLEAHAAFTAAAAEDSTCSRCWWGVAYSLGPGANRFCCYIPIARREFRAGCAPCAPSNAPV